MFAVYAAEQQYRHDTRTSENERRILASIRERSTLTPWSPTAAAAPRTAAVTVRTAPAWPRPIGLHAHERSVAAAA
ncbi:MAG: hypothetical protein ACTHNQ_06510 [Microbacterium sp.]|uniref:hypothetical protein n=1 Tax=Microbacterium sp. TaxID=51671 RepID=UPI003F7F0C3F